MTYLKSSNYFLLTTAFIFTYTKKSFNSFSDYLFSGNHSGVAQEGVKEPQTKPLEPFKGVRKIPNIKYTIVFFFYFFLASDPFLVLIQTFPKLKI